MKEVRSVTIVQIKRKIKQGRGNNLDLTSDTLISLETHKKV